MTAAPPHRWPTKLKRFAITDPFLRLVVAKYENEIPWGSTVKDSSTLLAHVKERMVPRLFARVAYPPNEGEKHYYVSRKHIDVDLALKTDQGLRRADIAVVRTTLHQLGRDAAEEKLVEVVNKRKATAFRAWSTFFRKAYKDAPAFAPLLLRPLFELAGAGSRRSVLAPSAQAVAWLYKRIAGGRVAPNEDLARAYCNKVAGESGPVVLGTGWYHFECGSNPGRLAAFAQGSGWCISIADWGARYLEHNDFFILRSNDRPVVALRTGRSFPGAQVYECQGRGNREPSEWGEDIALFASALGLELMHRREFVDASTPSAETLAAKPLAWWRERAAHWPFAILVAPAPIRAQLEGEVRLAALWQSFVPAFRKPAEGLWLNATEADFSDLIELDPYSYAFVPEEWRQSEALRRVCLEQWLLRAERDVLTENEFLSLPDFVRNDPGFAQHAVETVGTIVQQRPRTREERAVASRINELMPAHLREDQRVARLHLVETLLRNDDGIYIDERFPAEIRERADFASLREQAWLQAMKAQPPLWFALPDDLRAKPDFQPLDGEVRNVDLETWVAKVRATPWLLTQKATVPKGLRLHRRILEAYRDGWLPHLCKSPWRIWVQFSQAYKRRVYMSTAILYDALVLDALREGFADARLRRKLRTTWHEASLRMQATRALQLAVLRAIDRNDEKPSLDDQAVLESIRPAAEVASVASDPRWGALDRELRVTLERLCPRSKAPNARTLERASRKAPEPQLPSSNAPNEHACDLELPKAPEAVLPSSNPENEGAAPAHAPREIDPLPAIEGVDLAAFPTVGDVAKHSLFGRCEVLGYVGMRIRLRQVDGGRIGEFSLDGLIIGEPLPGDDGMRFFELTVKPPAVPPKRRRQRTT
jgi:hypothetical protein